MALTTFGGHVMFPHDEFMNRNDATFFASALMDASAEEYGASFQIPKTGTISKIGFRTGTVTVSDTLAVGLYTLDSSGYPTSTAYGGMVAGTQASLSSNTAYTVSLGTNASVTRGDFVGGKVSFSSYVAGNLNLSYISNGFMQNQWGRLGHKTASWTTPNGVACMWFEYDDGTYEHIPGVYPVSGNGRYQLDSGRTPDELALKFTPQIPMRISGVTGTFTIGASSDVDFILYDTDGTSVLQSVTADNTKWAKTNSTFRSSYIFATPQELESGSTYRLAVQPQNVNDIFVEYWDAPSVAAMDSFTGGQNYSTSERTNAGAWTDTTTRVPVIIPLVDQFAGGGGLLVHPGMSGGARG